MGQPAAKDKRKGETPCFIKFDLIYIQHYLFAKVMKFYKFLVTVDQLSNTVQ